MPYMPSYSDMIMPQAMYGMGYGGYVPLAQGGMEVTNPPREADYMGNQEQYQADMDAYLQSVGQNPGSMQMPQMQNSTPMQGGYSAPPQQKNFPDYENYSQAMDQYLGSIQQQADSGQMVPQGRMTSAPSPYVPTSNQGYSIVDFLAAQGKPADFASRKELASALGITNYRGTATQNKQMMQILQQNPDILYEYEGIAQPTGGVRKRAASGKNAKGAPSTQSIAQAKQEALGAPTSTSTNTSLQGFGYPSVENANRLNMIRQRYNRDAALQSSQPMFRQGYEKGGEWNGTWNGNQGFGMGGSYLPDYASNAYGLPQFEMGAPIYANGGMSPEEAMMMQQQGAAPEQGGGMDQQQIVQAVMQMIQQGMDPNQIMQQLVQGGIPPEMAEQVIMMVMQQVQGGGGPAGGQGGMGGGQPNGMQQPMAPPSPEQGMEGMPMPGGMARGGMTPGWEGEVTMAQLEDLKRKGIKFDII
jgi:hypothetical protein